MLKLNEELKDKISYGFIVAILLTAVVPLVITVDNIIIAFLRYVFIGLLAGLYLLTSESKDLFFLTFGSFVLFSFLFLCMPLYIDFALQFSSQSNAELIVRLSFAFPFILSAVAFGLLAYKHSKEFKAFEMLEFLLVLFLLITSSKYVFKTEYSMYYAFGTCFLIATLIYNNNLWMRYKDSEKELLILLLVVSFVDVIQVSAKFIAF